ncbi:Trypsin-1 [Orchesella cincta]|uniref:Trypsin-1 n=1 Tax=Orchesella cincta TaxID=48709 RepID=A0A1D2MG88_ORCCI|nr:Trypsin-1 [Orchesella cincta]
MTGPIQENSQETLIVGGTIAERGEFPYQVQLQFFGHYCGAAVYNKNWIITAAHCAGGTIFDYIAVTNQYNIVQNEGSERKHFIEKIVKHPEFDGKTYFNDIALMKTRSEMVLDELVTAIPMPPEEFHETPVGTLANVTGWGATTEGGLNAIYLHYVTMPIIGDEPCQEMMGATTVLNSMICAGQEEGGKDSCQGDSGGPMVCDDTGEKYLCGIVSWGRGCGRPGLPGVYTQVSHFLSWIDSVIANETLSAY